MGNQENALLLSSSQSVLIPPILKKGSLLTNWRLEDCRHYNRRLDGGLVYSFLMNLKRTL